MKWLVGVVILLLAALLLQSGSLAYAMYVLLGLIILSRFLTLTWIDGISVTRVCHNLVVDVGATVPVQVLVRNHSWLPVPWLLLEDLLPAKWVQGNRLRLRVKQKRIKIVFLWSGAGTILDYEIHFKMRGYYQIGPLVLETGDLFGLHRRYKVGTEPQYVLVYPRVLPLEGYDLASRRPLGEIRLTHRLFEDPTRIAGIRPYQSGDSLRRIHWSASAHTGVLHSKVFEPSCLAGATLVLDFHQAGYDSTREPQRSELAVTGVASLAYALYLLGEQVGLVSNGRDCAERIRKQGWQHDYRTRSAARQSIEEEDPRDRLQPLIVETRPGVEQFERIRTMLARVELNDGLTLPQLLHETAGILPRNATLIVFLPRVDEEIVLTLTSLRRRGFAVAAILVVLEDLDRDRATVLLESQGIATRHFKNIKELTGVCRTQLGR